MPLLPIEWGKRRSAKRTYADMCNLWPDMSQDEMYKRIAEFHDDFRGMAPSITINGITFRATAPNDSSNQLPMLRTNAPVDNADATDIADMRVARLRRV